MSGLVIPAPTIEEQELEDFDPIPQIALAHAGVTLTPFQIALPWGEVYRACFDINFHACVSQGAVRFSNLVPPTYLPLRNRLYVHPMDEVVLTLHRGRS